MLARESSEHTDYERSYQIARRSLALSHQIHDRKRAADAMANLWYVTLQWGKFDDARDLFQRCLTTNRELRNQQGIADALSFLALTAYYGDDLETARMLNEESLALWSALDDRNATVWARTRLGTVLLRQGVYDAAYDAFMGSLLTSEQLGFRWGISWSLDGLAALSVIHQSPHLALRLAATAASVRDTAGVVLPPREQADTEELRSRINAMIGAGAEDAWRNQQSCSLDELVQMTRDNLCDPRPGTTQ
jgi:tetratricopeptide (TPR) repeat protein